ncbi:hypothetical protein ACFL5Z_17030 [Planctomycetota bacterium]
MKLTEFIRQNDIKCTDGEAFDHSPEFFKMKEFERTCHRIHGVPFLDPETHEVKEIDVRLTGYIQENWDKFEKKTKQQFFVNRSFRYPDSPPDLETIDDSVVAGRNIDEAIEILEAQKEHFEFFKRYDLIDAGRYWLNRDLKRCFVDEGKVIVLD